MFEALVLVQQDIKFISGYQDGWIALPLMVPGLLEFFAGEVELGFEINGIRLVLLHSGRINSHASP